MRGFKPALGNRKRPALRERRPAVPVASETFSFRTWDVSTAFADLFRNFEPPVRHNYPMSQNRMSRRAVQVVAENRIREAIEEGQFDDLPGLGKPIADIDEPYDPDWWIKKWIRREGMSRELAQRFGKDFWAKK